MTRKIPVNRFRFMPEIAFQSDAENFLSGGKTLIELSALNKAQQMVLPLSYQVDSVDSILINHIFDDVSQPELDSGSLKGIDNLDQLIGSESPYAFIFDEYRMNATNNTGGTSTDFRARLSYAIQPSTVLRKLANRIPLSLRDLEAATQLKDAGIVDVDKVFQIGFRQPENFTEGLNDRNKEGIQRALVAGVNLSATRQELISFNVTPGDCAILKNLVIERPIQAEVGELTVFISRDDDDDLISYDPAVVQSSTSNLNLHIPAYDKLKVELLLNSGTHNNFKAFAGVEIKQVGLFTKARLQEFSGESFPTTIAVSVEDLGLKLNFELLQDHKKLNHHHHLYL